MPKSRFRLPWVLLIAALISGSILSSLAAGAWVDVSTALLTRLTNSGAKLEWPGGCSGVVVNRTNGDVTIKVVSLGLWRSSDRGIHWERIDQGAVSGRDETGWATSVDPHNPERIASFSLDGTAGWTTERSVWKRFATLGRNWDYGSVDWKSATPRSIIAAKHETSPPGEVYATSDAGITWRLLPFHLRENRSHVSMVGALGPGVFIYSNGDGILRSADDGLTWTRVSAANPLTRIPVSFRRVDYLGTTNGLLTSRDSGSTWQTQGTPVEIWQGPFFGRDEAQMVVVGRAGVHLSRDGGVSWKRVAELKSKEGGFLFTPHWFGCYAWDPVHNDLYVSSMGNAVYRMELPETRSERMLPP